MNKQWIEVIAAFLLFGMVAYLIFNGPDIECEAVTPDFPTSELQDIQDELCGLQYDLYQQEAVQEQILEEAKK